MSKIKHIIYKYVLNGEVLYIGKSSVGFARLKQHGRPGDNIEESAWNEINRADIYFAEMADGHMADVYESELIRRHRPKYNKAKMNDWAGLPLPEPNWTLFRAKNNAGNRKETDWKHKYECAVRRCEKAIKDYALAQDRISTLVIELEAANTSIYMLEAELKNMKGGIKQSFTEEQKLLWKLRQTMAQFAAASDAFKQIKAFEADPLTVTGPFTFDDVIKRYRDGEKYMCYVSISYGIDGRQNCRKMIFTDAYDILNFEFAQNGTAGYHGGILYRRDQDGFQNYAVLRAWQNRGSNEYFCFNPKEQNG